MLDTLTDDDDTVERPRASAHAMGFSLATWWRRVKDDPEFPPAVSPQQGPAFTRRTCCLYYRLPGGGLCGDCVLHQRRAAR